MLDSARRALGNISGLAPRPLPGPLQRLRPLRSLGLINIEAESFASPQLRSATFLRTSIAGRPMVSAVVACPDHALGRPVLSVDAMITGSSLLLVLEVLDPGVRDDLPLQNFLATMAEEKAQMLAGPVSDASLPPHAWNRWYVPGASLRVKAPLVSTAAIIPVFERCAGAYARLLRDSAPLDAAGTRGSRQQVETYVETLLDEGGPAVETFRLLLGRKRQREFVRSVMFGLETAPWKSTRP
jgi:hypothetical protein